VQSRASQEELSSMELVNSSDFKVICLALQVIVHLINWLRLFYLGQ
jgi:hypothetical protein